MKKSLPERPSLEWLRRQSKDLLKQLRAKQPDALARLRTHHPEFGGKSSNDGCEADFALHHAQLVVAREHGFRSWARLKQEVKLRSMPAPKSEASDGGNHVLIVRDAILDVFETAESAAPVWKIVERLGARFAELHEGRHDACPIILRNHDPAFVDTSREEVFRHEFSQSDWLNLAARYLRFEDWETVRNQENRVLDANFESAVDAVISGDVVHLRRLLREQPELVSARSGWGHEAMLLHYVAANGVEIHRQFVPPNIMEVTAMLLDAGSDPDALCKTYGGGPADTTLCLLISSGHPGDLGVKEPLVEMLLDRGASLDGVGGGGDPLRTAVMFGLPDISELLVRQGANPLDLKTAAGAGVANAVVRFLSEGANDAEVNEALYLSARNGYLEIVERLLDHGAEVDAPGLFGATPLLWAAYEGHLSITKTLIKRGADPNRRDARFKASAAGWANESGNVEIRDWLIENGCHASIVEAAAFGRIDLVRRHLLEDPERVDAREGRTALHEAAGRGFAELVELLLNHGAQVGAKDRNGQTPLDWAKRHHRDEIIAMLEPFGG